MTGEAMEVQEQEQGVSAEQAADLARLQAAANEQAGELADAEAREGEGARNDMIGETRAVIAVAVGLLVPVLPYLGEIYTDDVQGRIAAAYVPVAEKYGWQTGGGIFEKYGAEVMLAATVLPVAMQTKAAHVAWVGEREREARARAADKGRPAVQIGAGSSGEPAVSATAIQFGTAQPAGAVSENG